MIVSASYRTDIPAFYGDWFARRLMEGFCLSYNAFSRTATRVSLRPEDVDGYVFWTKNVGPFLPVLRQVSKTSTPFVVEYTITGYPRALEPAVTPAERAAGHMRVLADMYGSHAVVWRYDPVILTSITDESFHIRNFERLCGLMQGITDEVVVSFVQWYRKTSRNVDAAARLHGFTFEDPSVESKRALLGRLADIAAESGISLSVCSQPDLVPEGGKPARCIDTDRLSRVADRRIAAPTHGNRAACLCAKSVDIGAYDTCPHGCVYCYAVADTNRSKEAFLRHDPEGEFLVPPPPGFRMADPAESAPAQVQLRI